MWIRKEIRIVEEQLTTTIRLKSCLCAEGGDLRKFKVEQLKTYLRHHGLRIVGVKFVILSRIHEHQRYEFLCFLSLNLLWCKHTLQSLLFLTAYLKPWSSLVALYRLNHVVSISQNQRSGPRNISKILFFHRLQRWSSAQWLMLVQCVASFSVSCLSACLCNGAE